MNAMAMGRGRVAVERLRGSMNLACPPTRPLAPRVDFQLPVSFG